MSLSSSSPPLPKPTRSVEEQARLELQVLLELYDERPSVTEYNLVLRHFTHWLSESVKLETPNNDEESRPYRVLYQELLLNCERVIGEARVCNLFRCEKDANGVYSRVYLS